MVRLSRIVLGLVLAVCMSVAAAAAPISVGSGENTAYLVFNWGDSAGVNYAAEYLVSFTGSITGYELADLADTGDDALTLTWNDFGFGRYLNIASYDAGSAVYTGDGDTWTSETPENYWHYYVDLDNTGTWGFASSGADDTIIDDESRNAWVFGTAAFPVPEPASLTLIVFGAAAMLRRRR